MPESELSVSWFLNFGDAPVHPRYIIDHALSDPEFMKALIEAVPDLTLDHLLPAALAKWLSKNENRLLTVNGTTYRFSRDGHRWRCLPVKVMCAAE